MFARRFALMFLCLFGVFVLPANAQVVTQNPPTVSASGTLKSSGTSIVLPISTGQNVCVIGLSGATSFQVQPEVYNVAAREWDFAPGFSTLTSTNTYIGVVDPTSVNAFALAITSLAAGQSLSYTETCGPPSTSITVPANGNSAVFNGTINGDVTTQTVPLVNATAYGAVCNGTADDTTAIQNAITKAEAVNGGTVLLPRGHCEAHGLSVNSSNVFLEGYGSASDDGAPTSGTILTYNGTTGGTLLKFQESCGSPPCSLQESGGGIERIEIGSGSGAAAYGVVFKGWFMPHVTDVTFANDGNFTTAVFDYTFDANLNIPGTGRAMTRGVAGNDPTGTALLLDGTYQDVFEQIFVTYTNGDIIYTGGGATVNDEADHNYFYSVTGVHNSGTGIGVDFNCNSYDDNIYGIDPASGGVTVRGTTTCAGKNGASTLNAIYGYTAAATQPTIESGGGLFAVEDNGYIVGKVVGFVSCNGVQGSTLTVSTSTSGTNVCFDGAGDIGASRVTASTFTNGGGLNTYAYNAGNAGTNTTALSFGCAANASHPCIWSSTTDVVNGITGNACTMGIAAVKDIFVCDGNGNLAAVGALSGGAHNSCSSTSGWPCETTVTCSISAGTTCSATAFAAPAGSVCTATSNGSDTTTGVESWKISSSFVATVTVASSQTATAAANVGCK